ncbi:high-affinity branched-chain amino acid ABC transporter permease LivM [Magnetospirillum molischianum]|uniref:High-affinity branched-chain amino acid ABC transporter (Permease protein) n=1 Tax=Magnetospirillum molischianum DSM 120 TaxID=1150626 RepID=H8FRD6_MAGML|nr:high-affinity branched-chain amino acid ABC transporter permease LivM [Magnetospirillum molischianum]CCG40924.1 high-affinity branched-chain amino acid ABC transporter (permease protein) [Magnetospirillum molischianum DSM 120]
MEDSSPPLIRSAALAALLAALLALPLLGVRLVDSANGLSLSGRPELVAWAAGGVFCGRLIIDLFRRWIRDFSIRLPVPPPPPEWTRFGVGWALALFALVLPFLPFADRNLVDKATMVLIYIMLGWGLNIVVGLAGLLDLGFVAFYAVGAYSYALLSMTFGLSFWVCLPLAGLFAAAFGLALGFPVLRLRGDYLAIVTLGFGEIIRIVLQNWQDLTGGPIGISGIERPSLFGLSFKAVPPEGQTGFAEFFGLNYSADHRVIFLYFLILALALATNLFTLRIRRLPVGRAWEALREDEIACRSLGINPTTIKLSAFALGAMFAGFAGSFFATRQGFISPESFTFIESAMILAIVVLGGMGSQIGIVLAALLLVGLPEWFRDLQMYRMLAFGAAMVLIMLWKPSGLLSSRSPTIRLGGRA